MKSSTCFCRLVSAIETPCHHCGRTKSENQAKLWHKVFSGAANLGCGVPLWAAFSRRRGALESASAGEICPMLSRGRTTGISCGAGWYPARRLATGACWPVYKGPGGLPTRRRLPTCPTTSAEFPFVGKLSGIGQDCLPHQPKAQHLNGVPLDSPRRHSKTQSPSVPEPQRHSIPDRPAGAPCPDARPPRPPSPAVGNTAPRQKQKRSQP